MKDHVSEDNILQLILHSPPCMCLCVGIQACATMQSLCGVEDQNLGFCVCEASTLPARLHSRQLKTELCTIVSSVTTRSRLIADRTRSSLSTVYLPHMLPAHLSFSCSLGYQVSTQYHSACVQVPPIL